jgi:hypothetical protein
MKRSFACKFAFFITLSLHDQNTSGKMVVKFYYASGYVCVYVEKCNLASIHTVCRGQGDQIGRILAHWVIVYFGQIF